MAKIIENALTIKFSKLVRDDEDNTEVLNEEILTNLDTVLKELAGEGVLVEIYPVTD